MSSPPQKRPVGLAELLRLNKEKEQAEAAESANPSNPSNQGKTSHPANPSLLTNPADPANPSHPAPQTIPTDRPSTPEKQDHMGNTSNPSKPSNPGKPSKTSYTTKTGKRGNPSSLEIAPTRDFMRVANSITREAVRDGMFVGKSKQLYDCLYARTRGAIIPKMAAQIPRETLMDAADISSTLTLRKNLMHLKDVGLVTWQERAGVRGGNEYTVYLPEEVERTNPGNPPYPAQTGKTGQKLEGLQGLETNPSNTGITVHPSTTYSPDNTSFNTNTTDDEAFRDLIEILSTLTEKLVGARPNKFSRKHWAEVGQLLAEEIEEAAARTESVSSVPGLLAAHMRRKKLAQKRQATKAGKSGQKDQVGTAAVTDEGAAPGKHLGPAALEESVAMFRDLIGGGGYDLAKLTEQFAAGYNGQDWARILTALQGGVSHDSRET